MTPSETTRSFSGARRLRGRDTGRSVLISAATAVARTPTADGSVRTIVCRLTSFARVTGRLQRPES